MRRLACWRSRSPSGHALGEVDLVVSSPLFGLRPVSGTLESPNGNITVSDSESHVLTLKAASHLTEDGEAIFVLPSALPNLRLCSVLQRIGMCRAPRSL